MQSTKIYKNHNQDDLLQMIVDRCNANSAEQRIFQQGIDGSEKDNENSASECT